MKIIPLILSGGAGTRLWPLSRRTRPKQFLKIGGDYTLFQNTVLRCRSDLFEQQPIVVASNEHRFLIAENLRELGVEADILLEPVGRNSFPAILAGCLQAIERDPEAIVLVLAADHRILDEKGFGETIRSAIPIANEGKIITFGVTPDHPATGYGYIEPGASLGQGALVKQFVEKPELEVAKSYVQDGFLWNSGNFMFSASDFLELSSALMPATAELVSRAFKERALDLDYLRLKEEAFAQAESISVDYAILEKTDRAAVVPVSHDWSDIGTWQSVWKHMEKDDDGNVSTGDVVLQRSGKNLVHSEKQLTTLVGVDDLIVVATRDTVLVADKASSEEVKDLVEVLAKSERSEATNALKVFRPWGNYEALDSAENYQVKRIVIAPGGELSLQKHQKRSEHWVVVEGQAEVTVDGEVQVLNANQSTYIPLGSVHRLANRTMDPVAIIEVQTGTYFGEDDIIRLEDRYNRSSSET
ncbi:MAG: mannose-1-phosphate guanylyltransferase/mannose-6-phosphate isomerase [Rhizobiaceae bacterium]|nr:mannose-1-phosphate guanylyltransferase/mannose-6-phosphate isomerase [Rhizobiaceae bacterium]